MKMKFATLVPFLLLCLAIAGTANAQITSNGTGGGVWSATTTWSGGVVPDGSGTITITGTDAITIDIPITITGTLINSSTGALTPGANLTIGNGGIYQHNTTVLAIPTATWSDGSTLSLTATAGGTSMTGGLQSFYNILVNQSGAGTNLNLRLVTTGSLTNTVRGSITVLSTGTTPGRIYLGDGSGATINVTGNISVSGNSQLAATGSSSSSVTVNVGGDVTISGTSNFGMTRSTTSPGFFNITGNLTVASACTLANSNTGTAAPFPKISFVGTGSHAYNVTAVNLPAATTNGYNVEITGGGVLDLNSNLTIPLSNIAGGGTVYLTNGKIVTGSNAVVINNTQATAVTGGSSSNYIDGRLTLTSVAATSLQTLNFPIGAGTAYRPIVLALTQAAATATPFTAQIINGSVPSNTLAATIDKVSSVGYATLSGSNVASATVQLSYIAADNITDITNLRIAQGPVAGGGTWVDLGGTGSAVPAGTITSTPITDLTTNTVFVLANSIDGTNVLPIQLTSFTAIASGLNATLAWTTATETNNAGFAIERKIVNSQSSTVNSWSKIAFIIGNGTSAIAHSYSYTDASASAGTYDYRLKQIDADGTSSYSSESEVIVGAAAKALSLSNYPNPFNPSTSILFSVPADGNTIVKIYNIIGQEVATAFTGVATAGKYYKATFDGSRLASGVYYYSIQNNGQKMVKKMLMVK